MNLIVAIGEDGAIGRCGSLIWKISDDLKRFKALTTGHAVIMGRKTWESLPKKPLPGRKNIVVTRQKGFRAEGAEVAHSINEAIEMSGDDPDTFVIGGAEIYKAFMPYSDRIYLTRVYAGCEDADAFLHFEEKDGWHLTEMSEINQTPEGLKYQYLTYQREINETK